MRKMLRIAPIALLLFAMPTVANASTTNQYTYVAGSVVATTFGSRCAPAGAGCVAPGGGFSVTPAGTTVVVRIADTSGPDTPYSVCQDNSADPLNPTPLCGDGAGDVQFNACSTAASRTFAGFIAGAQVSIFVFAADTTCGGNGSVGTATVTF